MTDNHPITPQPELRLLWAQQGQRMDPNDPVAWMQHVSTQAARWGADQELDACIQLLDINGCPGKWIDMLRTARRPKPPSLKEQALEVFEALIHGDGSGLDVGVIRRALEQLPND